MPVTRNRFVALDGHKNYVLVGAVNVAHQVVLQPRKVAVQSVEQWCQRYLRATDEVVLEATTNAWAIYDQLEPMVVARCHDRQ